MEWIGAAIGSLSLVGSVGAYIVGLRIKTEIDSDREKITAAFDEKLRQQRLDMEAHLAEKTLNIVNGRYIRADLCQQSHASLREILDARLGALETYIRQQLDFERERHEK